MAKQPKPEAPTTRPWKVRPVWIREMRVPPEDVAQRKFRKAHAEEIAANLDLNKLGIPIVNFRSGIYWLIDGQHRVAALKTFFAPEDAGQIECQVFHDLQDSEMAEIFLAVNAERRAVSAFTNFQVSCTADRESESDIRRIVEANKLKISREHDTGCINAVSAMRKVYDAAGGVVLGQVLRVLRDGFASDSSAFDGQMIRGLGYVFGRYNGKTNEKHLAEQFSKLQHGPRTVLQRAETLRERTGNQKGQCVAAAVVETYNKGAQTKGKLPSWWKEAAE